MTGGIVLATSCSVIDHGVLLSSSSSW